MAPLVMGHEGTHWCHWAFTLHHGETLLLVPLHPHTRGARTWLTAALGQLRWSRSIPIPIPYPRDSLRFGGRADFLAPARQ